MADCRTGADAPLTGIRVRRISTRPGPMALVEWNGRLVMCDWTESRRHQANLRRIARITGIDPGEWDCRTPSEVIEGAAAQIDSYLEGISCRIDLPIAMLGTPFQVKVWSELLKIPYGGMVSYGRLASLIGCPQSVRAVAMAVGSNPLSLVVPCHRVVGSDGSLTGYAGGLAAKTFLLALESESQR